MWGSRTFRYLCWEAWTTKRIRKLLDESSTSVSNCSPSWCWKTAAVTFVWASRYNKYYAVPFMRSNTHLCGLSGLCVGNILFVTLASSMFNTMQRPITVDHATRSLTPASIVTPLLLRAVANNPHVQFLFSVVLFKEDPLVAQSRSTFSNSKLPTTKRSNKLRESTRVCIHLYIQTNLYT